MAHFFTASGVYQNFIVICKGGKSAKLKRMLEHSSSEGNVGLKKRSWELFKKKKLVPL